MIEGQLKEKRRRWKLFRQWRTKYFTLSGANLSCRELVSSITVDMRRCTGIIHSFHIDGFSEESFKSKCELMFIQFVIASLYSRLRSDVYSVQLMT